MKALHLVKTSTGASWALRQMAQLVKLGVDVHVALPVGGKLWPEYARAGIIAHPLLTDLPLMKPWLWRLHFLRLRQLVAAVQPDIIHSHFVGTTLTMRWALRHRDSVPRVFQIPGPLHLENWFTRKAEILSADRSDHWIATSRWIKACYLRTGIGVERVHEAAYCPDIEKFEPLDRTEQRRKLGLDANARFVGMVAYFYPPRYLLGQTRGIKGHEDLIDAFRICLSKRDDLVCLMIGGSYRNADSYMRKVREYAYRRCGARIVFVGEVMDVAPWLASLDVAVVASHSENFGGTGEALLMEIPTVATPVGGIPDLIVQDKTGWLVPSKNPPALASAILNVLDHPEEAKAIAKYGRRQVMELYGPDKQAETIVRIYKRLSAGVNKNENA